MSRFENYLSEAPDVSTQHSVASQAKGLYAKLRASDDIDTKINILAKLVLLSLSMSTTDKGIANMLK